MGQFQECALSLKTMFRTTSGKRHIVILTNPDMLGQLVELRATLLSASSC